MTAPVYWEGELEKAIVERLKPALAPLPVKPLPEKDARFTHAKGDALVILAGIDGGAGRDMGMFSQQADFSFEVMLRSRSLRDHTGLYRMLTATRLALLGWAPDGGRPLRLVSAKPQGQDDGVWSMAVVFATDAVLVADVAPEGGPPCTLSTFEETGWPTVIDNEL